jgi:hypothetical protein
MDRPLKNRGRGECRELAAPMARLQKKMQAAGTTGSAETSRHSPRDGFTAYIAISPVRRAFWPPSPARRAKRRRKLDISVGMPGPRDLTVRIVLFVGVDHHAATPTRPPHPASTSVTTAKRPSCETGWGQEITNSDKTKGIFLARDG